MSFEFIDDHRDEYPITLMCQVLDVSRSGYYAWRTRGPSEREMANQRLLGRIREIFVESDETYGSPRIHRKLRQEGVRCGRKRVARLMRRDGLQARSKRQRTTQTTDSDHSLPVAPNLLKQDFTATGINKTWLSDITYVATADGWVYLAVVMDLYSRKIVGWSIQPTLQRQLVIDALNMAIRRRRPAPGLIHHSDQGNQYASQDYQAKLDEHGMICSMSRVGNCFDNAPMESFFSTLKVECVGDTIYPTREAAKADLFRYIEVFYNRQRLHSSLGYQSPAAYEALPLVA